MLRIKAAARALIALAFLPSSAAALTHVTLVLSEPGGAYASVADAIAARLEPKAIKVTRLADAAQLRDVKTGLIVTIGARATQSAAALKPAAPLLATLIPLQTLEKISDAKNISAVVLDQPLPRQLRLVRAALPRVTRIGAVLGPDSESLAPALAAEARKLGFNVVWEKVSAPDQLAPALQRTLGEAEALLAFPDRVVSNRDTLHDLLLTSYRYRDPVIGYSAAYGKAGALLAIYTTPEQVARQTAEVILEMAKTTALPRISPPKYFSVDVNDKVARSLGLTLPSEQALVERAKP